MKQFLAVIAIPLTTALAIVVSAMLFGVRGPVVALLVNAFLVSEVAGFNQVFALPMPAGYFRIRHFEQPVLYERLGIKLFKRLMRSRVYRLVNPGFRLSGGRTGLPDLNQSMEYAEAGHAWMFVMVSAVAAGALAIRWVDLALWLTLFNVLFNAYPVMLQRYNRRRLQVVRQLTMKL